MFCWMLHFYVRIQNNKDLKFIKFYLNIFSHQPRTTCHFCWSAKKGLPSIPQAKSLNTSKHHFMTIKVATNDISKLFTQSVKHIYSLDDEGSDSMDTSIKIKLTH